MGPLDGALEIMVDVEMVQAMVDIDTVSVVAKVMFGVEQGGVAEGGLEQMTAVLVDVVGDATAQSGEGSWTVVDAEVEQMFVVATGGVGSVQDVFAGEEEGGAGICSEICVG